MVLIDAIGNLHQAISPVAQVQCFVLFVPSITNLLCIL